MGPASQAVRLGYYEHAQVGELGKADSNIENGAGERLAKEEGYRPQGRDIKNQGKAIQEGSSREDALGSRSSRARALHHSDKAHEVRCRVESIKGG